MTLDQRLLDRIDRAVARYGRGDPATDAELVEVGERLGVAVDPDYAHFAREFGGCFVGVAVYAIRNSRLLEATTVTELTLRFRASRWPGTENSLVFSFDLSGNPITLDPDGRVRLHDHDFGVTVEEAPSFAALLERCLHD